MYTLLVLPAILLLTQIPARPLLLVHYMPWFQASESELGWHWRMNKTTEEVRKSGRIASHYAPQIGPYDSKDPNTLELQLGWMKLAGFDGVLANWYGSEPVYDYADIHERTLKLSEACAKYGLKFGVVMEDQAIGNPLRAGLTKPENVNAAIDRMGTALRQNWLGKPHMVRLKKHPTVFVFGPQFFDAKQWERFRAATGPIDLVTLHDPKPYSQGVFDWPLPSRGLEFNQAFLNRTNRAGIQVPVAYPRFHDYYKEGGQDRTYGKLPDADGATYRQLLEAGLRSGAPAVQVATWNDWQEGTQIEPSREFGYRDLVSTQNIRRKRDPKFRFQAQDLDLPLRLYKLREKGVEAKKLEPAAKAIREGNPILARQTIEHLENHSRDNQAGQDRFARVN